MQHDLKKILDSIASDCAISGIADDSRKVKAGNIFFALRGNHFDGIDFIDQAIRRGAAAVVVRKTDEIKARNKLAAWGVSCPFFAVDDVRQALALAAKQFFKIEDGQHSLFAATGTNGKTTITYLLRHLLNRPTALIGTIAYDLIDKILPSSQTTPNALELYSMLADLPRNAAVALEVSSHALDQKRAYGLDIDGAIFSNLTSDHLDYHGNRERYFLTKRKLFSGENGTKPKLNILNGDDPFGWQLYEEFGGITYGIENRKSDYCAYDLQFSENETKFSLKYEEKKYNCRLPVIGQHNVENALAAIAAVHGESSGQSLDEIVAKLVTFSGVSGRLQRIVSDRGSMVFIDYAHTEDGLRRVLENLQKIKHNNIITIFGCGGGRDRSKRPKMMEVACHFSDLIIATSDNSRHEKTEAIFEDMKAGINSKSHVIFESSRARAIEFALREARNRDIVLIAGKGHETYQQIGDKKIPFSDVEIVKNITAAI
ncbi:MAG: UDP-N-acetylmuramoyl-L-alanyl-D-glutamate--2,6-diaminopimelate ligase [Puniceicoccales bacterium]|jgi:UDP-N-acetylmuramoyl-L-alanyl-D-glutamate--2,6-diaminopimelate ligase|nr:UDP-N-acetylmuramoyl-L-alanyl-D-glutamate--2,6-diaminopimelate ligase [Puniceicoccales bacterium]